MTERPGLSRRQALLYGGVAAAVPLLTAMRPARNTSPRSGQVDARGGDSQDDWQWCSQCQGLWYAGNGTGGACPGASTPGGPHVVTAGSPDYSLSTDTATIIELKATDVPALLRAGTLTRQPSRPGRDSQGRVPVLLP
jgi:hypothetical protein